jgi:hypothetical protein
MAAHPLCHLWLVCHPRCLREAGERVVEGLACPFFLPINVLLLPLLAVGNRGLVIHKNIGIVAWMEHMKNI